MKCVKTVHILKYLNHDSCINFKKYLCFFSNVCETLIEYGHFSQEKNTGRQNHCILMFLIILSVQQKHHIGYNWNW